MVVDDDSQRWLSKASETSIGDYTLLDWVAGTGILAWLLLALAAIVSLTSPSPAKTTARKAPLAPSRRATVPSAVRAAVWTRDGGRCVNCGSDQDLQFDHIIPVKLGGGNSVENMQVLCGRCNRHKAARIE